MRYTTFTATENPVMLAYHEAMGTNGHPVRLVEGIHQLNTYEVNLGTREFRQRVMDVLNDLKNEFMAHPMIRKDMYAGLARHTLDRNEFVFDITKEYFDGHEYNISLRVLARAEIIEALQRQRPPVTRIEALNDYIAFLEATNSVFEKAMEWAQHNSEKGEAILQNLLGHTKRIDAPYNTGPWQEYRDKYK